jgi:hypothetical protein
VEVSEPVAVGGEDGEAEYGSSYGRGGGGDEFEGVVEEVGAPALVGWLV